MDDTLERAAQLLWEHDCGCLPVVDAGGIARAMITDRDICMAAYTTGRPLSLLRVEDSMSAGLAICRSEESLGNAVERMIKHQVRRLPVVDDVGLLQGIVSLSDLACRADEKAARALQDHVVAGSLDVLRAVSRPRSKQGDPAPLNIKELPNVRPRANTRPALAANSKKSHKGLIS